MEKTIFKDIKTEENDLQKRKSKQNRLKRSKRNTSDNNK